MATDILTPDSYINEISEWVDKIYLISEEDYVHGGEDGYDNVPHQQLTNRTLYLKNSIDDVVTTIDNLKESINAQNASNLADFSSLRASVSTLSSKIEEINNILNIDDEEDKTQFQILTDRINEIREIIDNKVFNYAASDRDGGDALTVKNTLANNTQLNLVGVNNIDPNKLKYNTNITIDQDAITAGTFKGRLFGEAEKAKKLSNKINVSLYGDVEGTAEFDGSANLKINTNIIVKENIPSGGSFGPDENLIIQPGDGFKVPQFTVDRSGVLTKVDNRFIQFALDPQLINKTLNVSPSNEKLYLIGTLQQSENQYTYSNINVYERNGKLYSNNIEVADVSSPQNFINKTINGYEIKEAAARNVDNTIGGTNGSTDLVTSNALYHHTHQYAPSDIYGAAEKVQIGTETGPGNLIQNSGDNTIAKNVNIQVDAGNMTLDSVTAKKLTATDEMYIPGGKIWIENATGGGQQSFTPELEALISEVRELKQKLANLDTDTVHTAKINPEQIGKCKPMTVLSYQKDKYWLADNKTSVLTQNLALALNEPTPSGDVDVLTFGTYNLEDNSHNGDPCYVGTKGEVIFEQPNVQDSISKKIGFVVDDKLIFRPEDSNTDYVTAIENSTWELDANGNIQPRYELSAHDALWEQDVYGDFMPAKHSYSNELWGTTDRYELFPLGDSEVTHSDANILSLRYTIPEHGMIQITSYAQWGYEIRYSISTERNGIRPFWGPSVTAPAWPLNATIYWPQDKAVTTFWNLDTEHWTDPLDEYWEIMTYKYKYPFAVEKDDIVLVFMEMPIGIELKDYIKVTLTTDSEVIELQGEGGGSAPSVNVFANVNMWTSPGQSYWYNVNFSEWGPETPNNGG